MKDQKRNNPDPVSRQAVGEDTDPDLAKDEDEDDHGCEPGEDRPDLA